MRSILIGLSLILLAGCGTKQELKGSIYIKPFSVPTESIVTPARMSKETANSIVQKINDKVLSDLGHNTLLKPGAPCPASDYELISNLTAIDSDLASVNSGFVIKIFKRDKISVVLDLILKKCNGQELKRYTVKEQEDEVQELAEDVATKVTDGLASYRTNH